MLTIITDVVATVAITEGTTPQVFCKPLSHLNSSFKLLDPVSYS